MIPARVQQFLSAQDIVSLRPAQEKAIAAGLFSGKSVLVCTPTASGKTLIAEMAAVEAVAAGRMVLYVVPLKALASEKLRAFRSRHACAVGMSVGDLDERAESLGSYDILIVTAEKLDSLLRHHAPWLTRVSLVVIDEVHLLHDPSRGPTLEILITVLRRLVRPQLLALSATVGNPEELAAWLDAVLVTDDWRPVQLVQGVFLDGSVVVGGIAAPEGARPSGRRRSRTG